MTVNQIATEASDDYNTNEFDSAKTCIRPTKSVRSIESQDDEYSNMQICKKMVQLLIVLCISIHKTYLHIRYVSRNIIS